MIFTLFADLVGQGKTFIMVTHDVELARRIPRLVEVHDGILYENGQRVET
jgi:predicted ABC-type transport system involved in lysophospholipase L1 biosynthesis ATPase subunit